MLKMLLQHKITFKSYRAAEQLSLQFNIANEFRNKLTVLTGIPGKDGLFSKMLVSHWGFEPQTP